MHANIETEHLSNKEYGIEHPFPIQYHMSVNQAVVFVIVPFDIPHNWLTIPYSYSNCNLNYENHLDLMPFVC